jgi:hypothetical protein
MRCLAREPGRRPVSMEILRKELLASVERLRHVSSSVLARVPSSTSVVESARSSGAADFRKRRSRAATVLMLGLGGGLVGGLALLVDRAADPGPTPPLVATERAIPAPAEPSPPPTAPPTPPVPAPPPAATSAPRPAAAAPAAKQPVATLSKAGTGPTAGHKPPPREAPPGRAATPPRETPDKVLDAAEFEFQEGRLLGAVTLARRGLALGGGTKALMLLGKIYRTTGEFDRAVEAYDQILRKSPGDARAQEGRRKALASMTEASAGPPQAGK